MSRHTPGPWRHSDWNIHSFDPLRLIASAHFGGYTANALERAEVEANARLIAAAPELLAACVAMLAVTGGADNWRGGTRDALRLIEGAIEKAAGLEAVSEARAKAEALAS